MEAEEIAGSYARSLPEQIELRLDMPRMEAEQFVFDFAIRRDAVAAQPNLQGGGGNGQNSGRTPQR